MNLFREASSLATALRSGFSQPTRGLSPYHQYDTDHSSSTPPKQQPRLRPLLALPLLLAPTLSLGLLPHQARAQVRPALVRDFNDYPGSSDPFRFQATARGDIVIIGNTLMHCPMGGAGCAAARTTLPPALSGVTNASFNMEYVNTDAVPGATFANSSTATLNLPAGSTVVFAGLYWGAHAPHPGPIPAATQQVQFKVPGGSYTTVTAEQLDAFTTGVPVFAGTNRIPYQGFADVTSLVRTGGNGIYSVGDVAAQSLTAPAPFNVAASDNRYAGWALVIMYENDSEILRSLTVYDGFAFVHCPIGLMSCPTDSLDSTVTFTLSGFTTPSTSPVLTRVGSVVYEGDRGTTGEEFRINTTTLLSSTFNPANDFFNISIVTIDPGGAEVVAGTSTAPIFSNKNSNFHDQLGFDIDVIPVTGDPIPPGSTSAMLTFKTVERREGYSPGIFTLAIAAVPEPNFRLVKRITGVTRGGVPLSGVDFGSFIDDPADDDDNAPGFSAIPLVGLISLDDSVPLQSGDIIEYTVYFLSDGMGPTEGTQFCDPIPTGTTFAESSFSASSGILVNRADVVSTRTNAEDGDTGAFSSPLAPLPAGHGCPSATNPNGSVTVNLGTVSSTPGNNFGFVRFRVSLN